MPETDFPFHHGIRIVEPDLVVPADPVDPVLEYGTLRIRMDRAAGGVAVYTAVKYNGEGYGLQTGVVSGTQWYSSATGPAMTASSNQLVESNTKRRDDININLTTLLGLGTLPPTIDYYAVRWYPAAEDPRHSCSVVVSRVETGFACGAFGVQPLDVTYEAPGGRFSGLQFTIDVQKFIRNQLPFVG